MLAKTFLKYQNELVLEIYKLLLPTQKMEDILHRRYYRTLLHQLHQRAHSSFVKQVRPPS